MHSDREAPRTVRQTQAPFTQGGIEGMWVILIANEGELPTQDADGRVPVMSKSGDDRPYLLAFKNAVRAREFVAAAKIEGAEARMVVRANRDEVLRIARAVNATGILVDYDLTTQKYLTTAPLT